MSTVHYGPIDSGSPKYTAGDAVIYYGCSPFSPVVPTWYGPEPRKSIHSPPRDWFPDPEPTPPIVPTPAKVAVDESLTMLRIVEDLLALDVAARKRVLDYLVARFGA